MNNSAAVDLTGISKSFGSRLVLQDISLSINKGEGLCVCGVNASGKTTLLGIAAGLLAPGSGDVKLCGFDVRKEPERTKMLIGFVSHSPLVYSQLTVEENLRFFSRLYGIKDAGIAVNEVLRFTGLEKYRDYRTAILSAGTVKRLSIARAMIHKPSILLADEPFAQLDQGAGERLVSILSGFRAAGGTVLMTGHDTDKSLKCCNRMAVLDGKKIIFNQRVSEIDIESFKSNYLLYARQNG